MRSLKLRLSVFILVIVFALIYGCSSINRDGYYKDGYLVVTINQSFEKVYNKSLDLIKSGQLRDYTGHEYNIDVNKKMVDEAEIIAKSSVDSSDFIAIIFTKRSKDQTKVAVKHNKNGDTIGSSAFISMLQSDNLNKS
ncbi:DUF3568 family protein [Francisella sp. SYW-9]|uniref:DUF3568 family protein n=1 Tax=Francisella sp. SYW-9 TaxID=2610888 RepID=UPI00123DDC61|nr:DUF3568 family protein [Francisella sp. SYW-9]